MRKFVVMVLALLAAAALTVAGVAQGSAPTAVHLATISITKVSVTGMKATVSVKITGFSVPGGHWHLLFKKKGQAKFPAKNYVVVTSGTKARTRTLASGQWVLKAILVAKNHVPFSPKQYPSAKLSDQRTVRIP